MLFTITKRCNIREKWSSWQKKQIRWFDSFKWGILLAYLYLFTAVCSVEDKVGKLSRWKHIVLIDIKYVASKKFGLQIFWTLKVNEFHLGLSWYFFTVNMKWQKENFETSLKGYTDEPQRAQVEDSCFSQ